MANTILLTRSVNDALTEISVTDNTVYSNPTRNSVGVFLTCYKVNSRGGESKITQTPNNTPQLVTSWTHVYNEDGHYRYKYIAVPSYSTLTTYAKNDLVIDFSTQVVYMSIQNANTNNPLSDPTFWVNAGDPTQYIGIYGEPQNCDIFVGNSIFYDKTKFLRDRASVDAASEYFDDYENIKRVHRFTLLDIFVEAMIFANTSGEYNKGEKIARRASTV